MNPGSQWINMMPYKYKYDDKNVSLSLPLLLR